MDMSNKIVKTTRKIWGYYNKLSNPVKASIWFTISTALQRGISLLTMPIFTRLLTTEQYGIYTIYRSWYDILLIFGTLNIYTACYSRGLLKFRNNQKEFTSSMQVLMSVITVALTCIYLCNIEFWNSFLGLSSMYVYALFLEMFFVPAYSLWCMKERFEYRYKKVVFTTLLLAILTPTIGIIAVLGTTYKAEARVISYVFVQLLIAIPFCIYNILRGRTAFSKDYWSYALTFSIPLLAHYLSAVILNQSDRIMISRMVGSSEAAIYSVAYTISTMVSILTNAIQHSYMPYTYKSIEERKIEKVIVTSKEICMLVAGLCVIAMLIGPEIIKIFASADYYNAIWIVPPVAASIFFIFLYNLFVNVELYYEKNMPVTIVSCFGAGLNVALNYFFIGRFGYVAAGYTTLFSYIIFVFIHSVLAQRLVTKEYKSNDTFDFKFFGILSIVVIGFVGIVTLSYNYLLIRAFVLLALCFIFFLMRHRIISIIKNLRRK